MIVKKHFLQSLAFILFFGLGCAQADEIFVSSYIVENPIVAGDPVLISVTLSNDTSTHIRNVDLRLADSEMIISGNGVLQLGSVDVNGISTVLAELIPTSADGGLPSNILWRIDYDFATGNHAQVELISELGTEE